MHLKLEDVTFFGNRVFRDVIKVRVKMRSSSIKGNPSSEESVLTGDRQGHVDMEVEPAGT